MSNKPSCYKEAFATKAEARKACRRIGMRVYTCLTCGLLHITSQPLFANKGRDLKSVRQKIEARR